MTTSQTEWVLYNDSLVSKIQITSARKLGLRISLIFGKFPNH